jgi:hypothetical protein
MRKCGFGVLATDVEESEGLIVVVIVYPGTFIRNYDIFAENELNQ